MTLSDKTRFGLATWAKAILGDATSTADKKALAKDLYTNGVDQWNSRLFVFFQTHWSNPTDATEQSAVNDLVTATVNDYLAAQLL